MSFFWNSLRTSYLLLVVQTLGSMIWHSFSSAVVRVICTTALALLFIFFIEFACGLQSGYSGIILGHKMNSAKIGFSVLFGFTPIAIGTLFVGAFIVPTASTVVSKIPFL